MSDLTVERRPGRVVFVTGLLGHRAVIESLAELLADSTTLELAQAVAAASVRGGSCSGEAYDDAMNALAEHVGSVAFMFHDWDLEPIADAVNERRAVSA